MNEIEFIILKLPPAQNLQAQRISLENSTKNWKN